MGKYGYFDDENREYVITEHFTPLPWINFLNNKDFTAIISQAGGGASFYREASSGRITKYNQTRAVPVDRPGYYLYFKDQRGEVFSPTFEPVRTPLKDWKCRHGLGYTVFESDYKGLLTQAAYFVPRGDNVLLWNVKLTNNREETVDLSAFAFVEWSFHKAIREPVYFHWCRFYNTTVFNKEKNGVTYDCHVYEDQPKLKVYLTSSEPVVSYDCDRNSFLGRGGTLDMPQGIKDGVLANKDLPGGGFPVGVLQNKFIIEPGQATEFTIALGCDLDWETADKTLIKYRDNNNVHKALGEVKKYWEDYTSVFNCDLPDKDMERMLNIWNPYNCLHSFNRKMSITGMTTGMEKGGVQSRDSSQDSMSLVSLEPDMARERMELILQFQMPSGEFYSSFDGDARTPAEFYAIRSDNGVWPVYTVYEMISEWGEPDFLDKKFNYYGGESATVLDHLYKGLEYIASQRGRNNLPLIIDIDWNDNLYIFKKDGREETVMLAQQLVYACKLLKEMAGIKNRLDIIDFCDRITAEMTEALNSDGVWDGDWYKRYIYGDDDTPALGSKESPEGKIFLNTQSWAVISNTATNGRDIICMDKAAEMLDTKYGLKLLYPAFTGIPTPDDPLYNNGPGIRENGGVFHHANTWAIIAETILGRGDKSYDYYRKILPNVASDERGADVFINEPYCFSSTSLADPDLRAGEGDMAWFSGTVTWMYLVGTQYILGIRPVPNGLKIDPCIPKEWDEYKVTRKFRGCVYNICVKNPDNVSKGVKSIKVDGELIDGNILNAAGKTQADVEVVLG